jgi:hypothetical protein
MRREKDRERVRRRNRVRKMRKLKALLAESKDNAQSKRITEKLKLISR